MKRQLRFILTLIKMKLSHMMVFRLSFFGAFFVDGLMFIMQILVFRAIFSQTDSIGGWSRGEMLIFIGTFSLINALNMVVYFFGVNDIPNKIISGSLDYYLVKPVNPLLRLTFENIDIGSAPLVLLSALIVAEGARQAGIALAPMKVLVYLLLVLVMTVLWYDVEVVLRTIPFFSVSARNITQLEELLVLCMKIPGTLFQGFFKALFYFILPYGLMSTVPTQYLAGTLTPAGLLYGCAFTGLFTAFTLWFWKFGLKRYKSASS